MSGLSTRRWSLLGLALLLASVAAWPGLQSRPPGLDLVGPRLAELEEKVRQAEQAITANCLTKPGKDGENPALDLLQAVLTADPDHPQGRAAMGRLIEALIDWGEGLLKRDRPDLEGARTYWRTARDLAVAYRMEENTEPLDRLMSAIQDRELAVARRVLEKKLVAAERRQVPTPVTRSRQQPSVPLRSQPRTLSEADVKKMRALRGFLR